MNTWLITGCSSGLGRGIAQAALEQGEQVVLTARRSETLQDLVTSYPDRARALRLDLGVPGDLRQAVAEAEKAFGGIDILVNNAGHGYRAAIEESEPGQVDELFRTNFFAPMELVKLVLPGMRARRRGIIVNVSSIGAVRGALGNGYYSAAKGALELATEALGKETEHLGIRVLLVEPGALRTHFYGRGLAAAVTTISDYDPLAARYRKERMPQTADQPGDPAAAGRIVVETVLSGKMPLRLVLGSDAVKAADTTLRSRLEELHEWAPVGCRADFDAETQAED